MRKELRKKALLQLKDKYGKEIEQWEQLEQILRTTREKAESSIVECKQIEPSEDELRPPSALQDSASNVLIDDILFQVSPISRRDFRIFSPSNRSIRFYWLFPMFPVG